jgi:hypothetical protein
LLPFLEARLQDLLEHVDVLPGSMRVGNGTREKIKHRSEFELSEVHQALQQEADASDDLKHHVGTLKRCRNRLAHHEVVTEADVRSCLDGGFRRVLNEA